MEKQNILQKMWKGIKFGVMTVIMSTWWAIAAIILGLGTMGITYLITNDRGLASRNFAIVFFGLALCVILYVWLRQIWWFISGTGDSEGRIGLLKKLWLKIFKK